MGRARTAIATALLAALLAVASGVAGATTDPVPESTAGAGVSSTTTVTTTTPATGELARTGPEDDATRLGTFGFMLIGIGVVTLVVSRRLFALEGDRR